MSDQDKVISLDQRRAKRERPAPVPAPEPAGAAPPEAVPARPLSLAEPIPGKIVWLHCPTCGTTEYTELLIPGGRRHKCGTVVAEVVVDIDVQAEWTMAQINLARIDAIGRYLDQQRERFEEYQRRLELVAGRKPESAALDEDAVKSLPVAEVDALGLLISHALHDPAARFARKDGA